MSLGAGECWPVVGAGAQVCRAHTAREAVEESYHREEDHTEGTKMSGSRRLLERHTPEVEEEGSMWKEGQARIRIEENLCVVMSESVDTCFQYALGHEHTCSILNRGINILHLVDSSLQSSVSPSIALSRTCSSLMEVQ